MAGASGAPRVAVLLPVYNDWGSLALVMEKLGALKKDTRLGTLGFFIVDDSSTEPFPEETFARHQGVEVLTLSRNMGHQRALAIGLTYIVREKDYDLIVVMDADGEDRPEDVGALIGEALKEGCTGLVFASRSKRKEGAAFRVFYTLYKMIFMLLTGRRIRFGNFSAVPVGIARKLVHFPELWNSYPACVMKSGLKMRSVPFERGARYAGSSKMTLTTLILHGLGAIALFLETISVRVLLVTFALALVLLAAMATVFGLKLFTDLPILGWTSLVLVGLSTMLTQFLILLLLLTFMILSLRSQKQIIPYFDYTRYIAAIKRLG